MLERAPVELRAVRQQPIAIAKEAAASLLQEHLMGRLGRERGVSMERLWEVVPLDPNALRVLLQQPIQRGVDLWAKRALEVGELDNRDRRRGRPSRRRRLRHHPHECLLEGRRRSLGSLHDLLVELRAGHSPSQENTGLLDLDIDRLLEAHERLCAQQTYAVEEEVGRSPGPEVDSQKGALVELGLELRRRELSLVLSCGESKLGSNLRQVVASQTQLACKQRRVRPPEERVAAFGVGDTSERRGRSGLWVERERAVFPHDAQV